MKRSILIVGVLAAAMTAMAEPQTQSKTNAAPETPKSAAVQKQAAEKKVEVFTPLSKKFPPSKQTDKIIHVDGQSSQPWLRMVGPQPGWPAIPDPERRDAAFDVIWIGAPPSH